jgi:ficolin
MPLKNCKEILDYGSFNESGLYIVQPRSGEEFEVYCDMALLDGGWTVIQRRQDSTVSFDRSYGSYRQGFGNLHGNFWLGLDKIRRLILSDHQNLLMEVYFGVEAFFKHSTYARYNQFSIGPRVSGYRLTIGGYDASSGAGDSMSSLNGQKFSTRNTQEHCKKRNHFPGHTYSGGWWFRNCIYNTNLNGRYYEDGPNLDATDGISWYSWLGKHSLKTTVIAIRPTLHV